MRSEVSVLLTAGALILLKLPFPAGSLAAEVRPITGGEDRWIPSISISGGALIQPQDGFADSVIVEDGAPPVPLQGMVTGDDLVVSPFVGAGIELMAPALPIPTRPRFFLGAEILPTFGSDRSVAVQQDPGCIRGPDFNDVCETDPPTPRPSRPQGSGPYSEDSAQGEGTSLTSLFETLTFGANLGVAFPANLAGRQLRIKPSFGWIHYEVSGEGLVSSAKCESVPTPQFPIDDACTPRITGTNPGDLRAFSLEGSGSQMFNAIGGGLDLEMDTVRYGPVGASLFLGGGFYRTLGDRTISFTATQIEPPDPPFFGMDVATAQWEVEVDPWIYRAHVGIRFQWLGFTE
jgi:hypothetical protein